jgi:hypothetical protein
VDDPPPVPLSPDPRRHDVTDVPVQYFRSVIALRRAVTGAHGAVDAVLVVALDD